MLQTLSIRNIVLIEQLDLTLDAGLIVLTGETGAGKSIVLDALGLVLGARGQARLLRHDTKQGTVAANFLIKDNSDLQAILEKHAITSHTGGNEDAILLRRVLYADGKSKAFVNDIPVSITLLRIIGEKLIEIHGQHDQRQLFEAATHRMLVDAYGKLNDEVDTVKKYYDSFIALQEQLDALECIHKEALREEEYLRFVQKELNTLQLQKGEERTLSEKRALLMHREKLCETIQTAQLELTDETDVVSALSSAQRIITRSPHTEAMSLQPIAEALERALAEVNEATGLLLEASQAIDSEDHSLETIQERLFALHDAARKYHIEVDELPEYLDTIEKKLASLEMQDNQKAALEKAYESAKKSYLASTEKLTKKRKTTAKTLEKALLAELAPLKMADTYFNVAIDILPEKEWSRSGVDRVRFLASTNPGMPPGELSKIASGGELSRFMLALKVVLAGVYSVPTLIFDEIDTGIGGAVADAVGRRLELLGNTAQVLVVTHQPQVAARGASHLRIQKMKKDGSTYTTVQMLTANQRIEELARMLAGEEITEEARAAAEKLLEHTSIEQTSVDA